MKHFDIETSSVFGNLSKHLYDEYSMIIAEHLIEKFYRVVFRSSAMMVKYHADKKNHRTGFSFKDKNGEFVYGVILTFNPPEEESEDGGNWTLDFTFNQADMKDVDDCIDNFSDVFYTILQTESYTAMHAHVKSNEDLCILVAEFIRAIVFFLDENSNDSSEDVELEMAHIFKASVGFDGGKKVYSLTPGDSIKQIIKGDDETEKKVNNIVELRKDVAEMQKAAYIFGFNTTAHRIVTGPYCPFEFIA